MIPILLTCVKNNSLVKMTFSISVYSIAINSHYASTKLLKVRHLSLLGIPKPQLGVQTVMILQKHLASFKLVTIHLHMCVLDNL